MGKRKMGDVEAIPKEAEDMKQTYGKTRYDYEDLLVDEMEGD
jgi:hypothetical protein